MNKPLITAIELFDILNDPKTIILDATILSKIKEKTWQSLYIPNSIVFDVKNEFSDTKAPFPNTFPDEFQFNEKCRSLGINNDSKIIVYERSGVFMGPRVWWMFKSMGHENVSLLNGGFKAWVELGLDTRKYLKTTNENGDFKGVKNELVIKDFDFIQRNIVEKEHIVIDARSADRFHSRVPEPRKGLRSGHIKDAINLPFTNLLIDGQYKDVKALKTEFDKLNLDNSSLTFSCGSGITACVVLLAAQIVIDNGTSIYDGSWTEYGTLHDEVTE